MKKISSVSVEVSEFSKKKEEHTTINVPWKERFRILFFGKLHIRVQILPIFTIGKMVVKNETD